MENLELNEISKQIQEYLIDAGINAHSANYLLLIFWILVTALIVWITNRITKHYLLRIVERLVYRTKSKYDDLLIKRQVLRRLTNILPMLVIYFMLDTIFSSLMGQTYVETVQRILSTTIVFVILWAFMALLGVVKDIYDTFPYAKDRPIKSVVQVIQIAASFIAVLGAISILFDIDVTNIMTGLGATAAILLLVFKDTILGFVAGIQLSANKMVSAGDWITMPTYKADGTVIDITLNTVKVQNWDKTITTIPTYKMVEDSFINWKGMEHSGGRRIKRSFNIDVRSVKFCSAEMLERFKNIRLLKDYIVQKEEELKIHNLHKEGESAMVSLANGRHLTNIGVLRKYLQEYLKEHPMISNEMTCMVRHLQPTEKGQPIEIYAFSKDQEWLNYESIQADIFDHILAVIEEFDLRIYQLPSGSDFHPMQSNLASLKQL
ncbi:MULTISPECIES: mechanosensitive ion channel family protein [unclassified Carboxylicivirga]|uniref:mechanosensitive ion channel family protein n=1 Tax=Carboxylicivirga TaxID=1628153 RepID=UPI003D337578